MTGPPLVARTRVLPITLAAAIFHYLGCFNALRCGGRNGKQSSFIACRLCETMDACVLLESPSCTLRRVLDCFEINTGVAMTLFSRFDFDSLFTFRFLMCFRQNLTTIEFSFFFNRCSLRRPRKTSLVPMTFVLLLLRFRASGRSRAISTNFEAICRGCDATTFSWVKSLIHQMHVTTTPSIVSLFEIGRVSILM